MDNNDLKNFEVLSKIIMDGDVLVDVGANYSLGKIQGITLDSLLKNEKKIKLIKIDVEGAENRVLSGMKKIINYVENILIECHLDEDWDETKKYLLVN